MDLNSERGVGYLRAICTRYKRIAEGNRIEFDELMSEAWLSAAHALGSWDNQKGWSAESWIWKQVNRDLMRFISKTQEYMLRHVSIEEFDFDEVDEEISHNPEQVVDLSLRLDEVTQEMTEVQYQVFDMVHVQSRSAVQTADELGISRQAVYKTLKRLEKIFEEG